jgi:NAD(P)-dependent dehydrogenase (short-subunit alcohol dehydrogenase family)
MPGEMHGRIALVTGATSGIGRAVAARFAKEGASVAVAGRRRDRLDALVREVEAARGVATAIEGDVRDPAHAEDAVRRTVEAFGGLDVLVNNAGVIGAGPVETTSDDEWARVLDVDLSAPFRLCRAALPRLRGRRGANVVNVGSVAGVRSYANLAAYCVAKAGLHTLTQCLALEWAPHGIRVNAITPGVIVSELHTVTNAVPDYAAFLERSKTTHPLGFVGSVDDAAELILFLASDRARWITGGLYALDGGRALASLR